MPNWLESSLSAIGVLGLLSWLARKLWTRVDQLDRDKADRSAIAEVVTMIKEDRTESRESRRVLHQKIDATSAKVNATAVAVARVEGQLARGER